MTRNLLAACAHAVHAALRARAGMVSHHRWASLLGCVLVVLPLAWGITAPASGQPRPARSIALGFTFSQRQAEYLDVPWAEVYNVALDLSPTIIHLGAYWDGIEPHEGVYD